MQITEKKKKQIRFELSLIHGKERLLKICVGIAKKVRNVEVSLRGKGIPADVSFAKGKAEVCLKRPVSLKAGDILTVIFK